MPADSHLRPVRINQYGVFADRPIAGTGVDELTQFEEGIRYYATDTAQEFEWDGADWFEIINSSGGITVEATDFATGDPITVAGVIKIIAPDWAITDNEDGSITINAAG